MRIIAGLARGLTLKAPPGLSTRPTSDKVRGALFSKLQGWLEGAIFVDLFAGSGLVGLEAASRGAAEVLFVENHPAALRIIRDNMRQFTEKAKTPAMNWNIEPRGVAQALMKPSAGQQNWDIVWADPPYKDAMSWLQELLTKLPQFMEAGGIFVMEGPKELTVEAWEQKYPSWELKKINAFGKTVLLDFRLKDTNR